MPLLHRRIALAGAGLAAAITTLSAVPAAAATPSTTSHLQAAAGWLGTQFVSQRHLPAPNGDHFDEKFGKDYFPNYGENADVIFGLAAAKADQRKINAALDYLVHHLHGYTDLSDSDGFGPYDGSVAKLAVAAIVAGRNPHHLGGHNLMAALAADECPSASTTCTPGSAANIFSSISESFVILAEARARGIAPTTDAVSYFLSLQCANGGFTSGTTACGAGSADIDATSYAIMALTALGGHPADLHHAVVWLRDHQHAAGYWVTQHVPNADSTGLAAAALAGAGRPLSGARHWLRSQQVPQGKPGAGALRYGGKFAPTTKSATSPSVLATAQGLTGLIDGGSLATLTATGATHGSSLFPAAVNAPGHVRVGSALTVTGLGFAAGELVTMSVQGHRTGMGVGTFADPSGEVRVKLHLGRAFAGTRHIKVAGASSHLRVTKQIVVTIPKKKPGGHTR